ncbi:hypothetical protein [Amygdalobacter nucleatus]|uniref:AzlC protein n=1 Tax=Amygdalobacter nucleatus TaxID=3029274 RepID=A0A133YEH4_9FIRM|nr:hypothetical protein [Amygdalobacter nucleatus]KXB41527.1 hypothetical protein HMPREF1872_00613 [Amygdalobacter nucleatus]MDF0485634.1 hypothetical protein [Amygdalobacter nucleatus]
MDAFEKYNRGIVRVGRTTMVLGAIACLLPPLLMAVYFGYFPGWAAVVAGAISQISVSGAFYLSEPISYYPIVGTAGLYLSTLSGNSVNMRIPAAATAIEGSGFKTGTREGSLIGTIGMAVSVYVGIFFVFLATVLGQTIISSLPDSVSRVLGLIIPALYGGIFGQFAIKSWKTAVWALGISLVMTKIVQFIPGNFSFLVTLTAVFSSIMVAKTQIEEIKKHS